MEKNWLSEEMTKNFYLVNQFNENFSCPNVDIILSLFKKNKTIWQHPLMLNNFYCLICKETLLNPLSLDHLQSTHLNTNFQSFLKLKNIKLRHLHRSKRVIRRRFICSQDHYPKQANIEQLFNSKYEDDYSDSDLMLISKKKINIHYRSLISSVDNKCIPAPNNHQKTNSALSSFINEKANYRQNVRHRRYTCEEKNPINERTNNNYNLKINENNDETSIKTKNNKKKVNDKDKMISISKDKTLSPKLSIFKMFKRMISYDNTKKKKREDSINNDNSLNSQKNVINEMAKEIGNKLEDNRNEFCDICLQNIKDKYILSCGDFYCQECIRGLILHGLKDISQINKLCCPKEICKEPIENRVIEQLLTDSEYFKYEQLLIRVEGLMKKSFIPCPYPDCEHYGSESNIKRNIVLCGKDHLFCVKCLEILNSNELFSKDHICIKKVDETIKYLSTNKFIKKCPNCHTWVVREPGGCNNMTCLNPWCNYEFCWICEGIYENTHYKNPFSVCFGLSESDHQSKFSKYKSIRILKCVVIFLLLIFIILPIIMFLFSFVVVGIYVVSFVLDGSAMKNIKLKNQWLNAYFYFLVYMFYLFLSIASIPLGYIVISLLILSPPVLCIIKKCKKIKDRERN